MAQQGQTGRCGAQLLAAHQQALAKRGFQRLDAQGHSRQRQAERLGGGAETAVFNDGSECVKLASIEHVDRLNFY